MEFTIEPCRTKATYIVKPKKKANVDIDKLARKFNSIKITPIAGVFECEGEEFIVQKYGTITFKTLKDKEKIKKISGDIFSFCSTS